MYKYYLNALIIIIAKFIQQLKFIVFIKKKVIFH